MNIYKRAKCLNVCVAPIVLNAIFSISAGAQTAKPSTVLPASGFTGSNWTTFPRSWRAFPNASGQAPKTERGLTPILIRENGKVFARFPLHRYDPQYPGRRAQGTESRTNLRWGLSRTNANDVVEFTAIVRLPKRTPGVLSAYFTYNDDAYSPDSKAYGQHNNEVDVEMPHHLITGNKMWLNVFREGKGLGDGFEQGTNADTMSKAGMPISPAPNWAKWFSVKLRWSRSRIQWFLGDGNRQNFRLVRDITNSARVPNYLKEMDIHFSIWAPPSNWTIGNSSYQPSRLKSADAPFTDYGSKGNGDYFDVLEARVRALHVRQAPKTQIYPQPR